MNAGTSALAPLQIGHVDLTWRHRMVSVEYAWIPGPKQAPLLIFLHEGLGSLSMWRDFPQRLCHAMGCRGLVYSRPGYGGSTPRPADEHWQPDFMHQQADEVLPALMKALSIPDHHPSPWLFGHSDGGSIALLYAAHHGKHLGGVIVMAPHIMVEELSITAIEKTRATYLDTDLRERLARHHLNPDSAFWGWNDVWLSPAFRSWDIRAELPHITCPVLAVQGQDDEYGTLEQIRGIASPLPHTPLIELPACGHSPHRDQPEALIAACTAFFHQHQGDPA